MGDEAPGGRCVATFEGRLLARGGSRAFAWRDAVGAEQRGFVVRTRDGSVHAYANACPHLGVPLDARREGEATFFEEDGQFLVCSFHGALFLPATGACVAGPCRGDRLTALACREAEGSVVVFVGDDGAPSA